MPRCEGGTAHQTVEPHVVPAGSFRSRPEESKVTQSGSLHDARSGNLFGSAISFHAIRLGAVPPDRPPREEIAQGGGARAQQRERKRGAC
jgi:hypothetical protein